jgi:lipid-A-disaccharide synthase
VKYISLVNLIMDKPVVKELIQGDMNAEAIIKELKSLLKDAGYRAAMEQEYARLKEVLQEDERASVKAAKIIAEFLRSAT